MPSYIAFIDFTQGFDLVSRDGVFKVLPEIGCPPKLQSMVESFLTDMNGAVQFNGSCSEPFEIRRGVKQGCVLAPTLLGISFALLLKDAFVTTTEGIYRRTQSDDRIFNPVSISLRYLIESAVCKSINNTVSKIGNCRSLH